MPRICRSTLAASLALLLAAALLAGCGGGGGNESITHIQGSSATITKPMLNHWMRVMVGSDFRAVIGTKGPQGLVSEPANYAECAEAAKKVVPRSFTGKLKLSDSEINRKCRVLNQVVREQAIGYLLSAQWTMLQAQEQHVPISEAELQSKFLRFRKEIYKTEAAFQTYMKERHMVLSDVLYQFRRNAYVDRLLPKLEAKAKAAGGSQQAAYYKSALSEHNGLVQRTSCKAGYVMEDCKGYKAPAKHLPSPNVTLEAIVQGIRVP